MANMASYITLGSCKLWTIYGILGAKFVGDMDVPSLKLFCNLNKNPNYEIATNIKFMMEFNVSCQ
jgi:hypothetical protein